MKITNHTTQTLDFVTGTKDGVATTDNVRSGETKDVAADADSPMVKGYVASGAITVDARTAAKVEKTIASPTPASIA